MMELLGLSKSFDGSPVIKDVSLTVGDDEYLTILGASGSGKSTLLRLVAGLEWPDAGTVLLNGEDIGARQPHLRGLGFVQQKYALFPHLTVFENVAFSLRNRLIDPLDNEDEIKRRTLDMLDLVGLKGLDGRMVGQISGGQKQRVSLARTLVSEPRICLLDEPLGALDANLRERMTVELRRIRKALGVTFVHATGNEAEAMAMGDRMVVLSDGLALQTGTPDEVYDLPSSVQVARAVNAYNILSGETRDGKFVYGDIALPLPAGIDAARHYAVRFGSIRIEKAGAKRRARTGAIEASFIASEFVGSRMVYFFRTDSGDILEVEEHLSASDPQSFPLGEPHLLTWSVKDVLAFESFGNRIQPASKGVAA